jgi:hypothetical protein
MTSEYDGAVDMRDTLIVLVCFGPVALVALYIIFTNRQEKQASRNPHPLLGSEFDKFMKDPSGVEPVVKAFARLVETSPTGGDVRSTRHLPYPKQTILAALAVGCIHGDSDHFREACKLLLITLADYQEGATDNPLSAYAKLMKDSLVHHDMATFRHASEHFERQRSHPTEAAAVKEAIEFGQLADLLSEVRKSTLGRS